VNKKLQVVAVGAGYFAQFQLRAWQRLADTELVAIVDKDVSGHAALKKDFAGVSIFESLQDALQLENRSGSQFGEQSQSPSNSVDIIDIITPPGTHLSLIEQICALAPSATIVCQKPFCENLTLARRWTGFRCLFRSAALFS